MNYDSDILKIISNNVKPDKGKILISEPLLCNDMFSRSVVLLIDEYKDSFSGLILNLPSEKKLKDIIDGIENSNFRIYSGGPVDQDVLFYIHTFGFIQGAKHIVGDLYIDGNFEDIKKLVNSGYANDSNIRFFVGNSGWAPCQLNEEISFNSWLVTSASKDFIFSDENMMWKNSLNFVDKRYKIWENFPVDPELN
ncbi:MAG: YqgE/AlgH family protein, partial [Bacteroidales bacterium]|nr:YqgE/AlgH family protein [Bacteroidales bacterium]MDD3859273.1 YqgE/AlgH family protein [Bacteroidales bacterium]